jgi:hypothetical protein
MRTGLFKETTAKANASSQRTLGTLCFCMTGTFLVFELPTVIDPNCHKCAGESRKIPNTAVP